MSRKWHCDRCGSVSDHSGGDVPPLWSQHALRLRWYEGARDICGGCTAEYERTLADFFAIPLPKDNLTEIDRAIARAATEEAGPYR